MTTHSFYTLATPTLFYLTVMLILLFLPSYAYGTDLGNGQKTGSVIREDLAYLKRTVWTDARSVAAAPLEIGRVRGISLRHVLIGAIVAGSIGGLIALDKDIRDGVRGIDNDDADILQNVAGGLSLASLGVLYGAGLWNDEEQWRRRALTGVESLLVSFGLATLAKVSFGRMRPDAGKGEDAWFEGGRSFVSDVTTYSFASAEAVSATFNHA